jgi:hypothetical protein
VKTDVRAPKLSPNVPATLIDSGRVGCVRRMMVIAYAANTNKTTTIAHGKNRANRDS